MAHDHGGHSHHIDADSSERWLAVALALDLAFAIAEAVAGLLANSVALLSDSAHQLTDAAAIALALVVVRLARRPPSSRFTFGFQRGEILSAQVNGAALLVLAGIIGVESIRRLSAPIDIDGSLVIVVGLAGALVNGGAAWALARANRESLNVEGAFLHNLADLWSSLAAAVAGIAVVTIGFREADSIAALAVCLLMVFGGWKLLRESGRVLLEGTPKGMDSDEIGETLATQPGIVEVHDLHVWEVTSGFPALSAHVIVPPGEDCHQRRRELGDLLVQRFGIEHATLQVEHERTQDLIRLETELPGSS